MGIPARPTESATARLEVVGLLSSEELADVTWLVESATDVDGVRPLSEHVMLHLRHGGDAAVRNVLLYSPAGHLVAYAHLDVTDAVAGPSAELVVGPAARGQGYGRAVAKALLAESPDGRLRLWAHGEHPGARTLAAGLGLHRSRTLWQMRRSLFARLPDAPLPAGVTLRAFEPGRDDEEWLALNARAFAGHPEQAAWTIEDLHLRVGEAWFDPAGFLLAQRDGAVVGFHWTKVHGAEGHAHEPIGEVYVVGVDPGAQGGGLGRALVVAGLRYLRARGLPEVMLYVEADNAAAIRLYTSLGFTHWDTDVMYAADAR